MRRLRPTALMLVAAVVAFAAACAPTAPPAPTAAKPTTLPASTAPAAKPAEAAKPAPQPDAQAEWNRVLAAAKQEGTVSVIGPVGDAARSVLADEFEKAHNIKVEFLGASNRDAVPRVRSERGAGQFLWDVVVQGALVDSMKPLGVLDALEPALILTDVKDPKTWRGGQMEWIDPERTILVMTPFQRGTVFVNPANVKPEDIKSYKDLLDPKYRGKIVIDDPRATGPGQATFTFFYLHPDLGPDYIRALGKQEPTILKDFAQEVDAVAQGRSLILIGTADFTAVQRARQGVPVAIVDPRQLKEGSDVSPANGEVGLVKNAPHPNAARVYLNWLLSREGQTAWVRAMDYVSARLDVPTDHTFPWRVPQPGAIKTYTAELKELKETKVVPLLKEVFGQ